MGRPKLEAGIKRSRRVNFRLTAHELKTLLELSVNCGLSPGAFIRERLFNGRFPKPLPAKVDLSTYAELKKIGTNINQIARLMNSGYRPYGWLLLLKRSEVFDYIYLINNKLHSNKNGTNENNSGLSRWVTPVRFELTTQ